MFDEQNPVHKQTPPQGPSNGGNADRVILGGDAFLNHMIDSVSAGDMEQREWARAVADNEDIVAGFVAKVRQALRAVREARGLSVEMAAEQAGVSTSTLSRLESGGSGKIDLKLMARVALMLDVVPRLDFAVRGAAAVSVGDRATIRANPAGLRRLDQPSTSTPLGFRADCADAANIGHGGASVSVASAHDPGALDLRIRDLEARMAAVERGKPRTKD